MFEKSVAVQKPAEQPTPVVAEHVFRDKAQAELFKRTGLSLTQKVVLVVITVIVLAGLSGVGMWLYFKLQPFDVNQSANNNNIVNVGIPLQELDSDRDGLRDIDERRYGTDPNIADTDGDGLTDYEEVTIYKTNSLKADTDGDGYTDKQELDNGYDPNGPGKL